ncbi:hypothetical protein [Komagataeibacter oboediens]|uniref:hypothetical protein n=1 Tax=Komagataeibacter oboediens TaxID=65958 RepID=UPI001C2DB956|nr:hypothetical protein [Komagataeibacter oboediens]MBV1825812.1 hypothetical protein [Komagataeibacter oboediens]
MRLHGSDHSESGGAFALCAGLHRERDGWKILQVNLPVATVLLRECRQDIV